MTKESARYVVVVNPTGLGKEELLMFQNYRFARRTARQRCSDGQEFNSVHVFKVIDGSMFREFVSGYTKESGKVRVTW